MGKLFIFIGIALVIIGLLLTYKVSIPFFGKLPGDFVFKKENFTFYFPLATSLLFSIILSLIFYLFSR